MTFAEPTAEPDVPTQRAGAGWITYSGVMLVVSGMLHLVDGLWALDASDSAAIDDDVEELLWYTDSLETWGWVFTIVGGILILAGLGVFTGNQLARWVGIIAASLSMVTSMMWVFAYPMASLITIFLAGSVVYGLTAYGADESP